MDQQKIGAFIAQKRRELGLTQAQLGGMLGVSDKAVSKWERGVCLPDVSLYQPLCETLGVSLNDFFAGESVAPEETAQKAEEAMIGIARDADTKRRRLRRIIALLAAACLLLALLAAAAAWMLRERGVLMTNYVRPYDMSDREKSVTQMLNNGGYTRLFEFSAEEKYRTLEVVEKVYDRNGLVSESTAMQLETALEGEGAHTGLISVAFGTEGDLPTFGVSVAQKDAVCSGKGALPFDPADYPEGYLSSYGALERLVRMDGETAAPIAMLVFSGGDALWAPSFDDAADPAANWPEADCDLIVIFEVVFK